LVRQDSEWLLAVSDWLLAPNNMSEMAAMAAPPNCVFVAAVAAALTYKS
jgi:hypothetical protein